MKTGFMSLVMNPTRTIGPKNSISDAAMVSIMTWGHDPVNLESPRIPAVAGLIGMTCAWPDGS